tara:strand:+ start:112 stop:375 length:264 start_codon:yes stop_codon:yes gene_type:complete
MAKEPPKETYDSFIFFVRTSGSAPFSGKLKVRPGGRFQIDLNKIDIDDDSAVEEDTTEAASELAKLLDGKKIKAYPYGAGRLTLMVY